MLFRSLRKLVNRGFTPRMVGLLHEKIRVLAARIAEGVAGRGEVDLVRDLAVPMPLWIIAEMLGIREEDFDRFHDWSDRLINVAGNYEDPVKMNDAVTAYAEYGEYLKDVFEDRRRQPREALGGLANQADPIERIGENPVAPTRRPVLPQAALSGRGHRRRRPGQAPRSWRMLLA